MDDKNYKKFLDYANKNNKLILYNNRINLKVKDVYNSNEINLGYLAKFLCNNNEKIMFNTTEENDELLKLSNKYYKYKTKYILTKFKKIEQFISCPTNYYNANFRKDIDWKNYYP